MSRVEHVSWKESPCLCGKGQVTRHVASTDYVFGSADVSYSLDCRHCSSRWHLNGKTFVDRATKAAEDAAYQSWLAAMTPFSALAVRIIDRHVAAAGLKTRKAELAELVRLGLAVDDYRGYTAARRNGASPGAAASNRRNVAGLATIAGPDASELEALSRKAETLHSAMDNASKQVIRRKAPAA